MDIRELIRPLEAHFLRTNWVKAGVWTPTFTGFSADPANVIARYVLMGRLCHAMMVMPADGTSSAVGFTVSAPFAAAVVTNMAWGGAWWLAVDNGAVLTAPGRISIGSGGTSFLLYKDEASGGWTASGGKRAHFGIWYEIG